MSISFQGKTLQIDGRSVIMPWPVLDAVEQDDRVFVLFDPDAYLLDPTYKVMRREGAPAVRNLIALAKSGGKLWEAELPESADYYYRLTSGSTLVAYSFSSYMCEIDRNTGAIRNKAFLK